MWAWGPQTCIKFTYLLLFDPPSADGFASQIDAMFRPEAERLGSAFGRQALLRNAMHCPGLSPGDLDRPSADGQFFHKLSF